ncbi:peptidoglycan-binding protein [Streptomyces liangshanensis]|uniref:Peptidoglycan-binding protein n=1 Tax=Streptomyces liangshanensis TaxID=2717324 RepID=A0A6G9H3A0_9ACTN|nr:peptidoglycan-binding protein [Streptomyces liangshanensis]QIQ05012.1 peptidoglycan-binding protein [Streptomyces liangshanensis]
MTAVGGGPGCFCAGRVARAHRAGRSQEIAAAEVFDERRIRPYVTLPTGNDETREPFVTAGPLPPLAAAESPSASGASGAEPPAGPPAARRAARHPRRRRPLKAVALGAAAVAVLGTAAFAGGLFSGEDADSAHLDEGLAGSRPTAAGPDVALSGDPAGASRTASPDATRGTAGASPSPDASESPASAQSGASTEASAPPEAVPSERPETAPPATERPADAPPEGFAPPSGLAANGLRLGDSGPAVADLQQRLAGIRLYQGTPDGQFDQRVQVAVAAYQIYRKIGGDPRGVYGPDTRRSLEAEPATGNGSGQGQGDGQGRDHQGPGRRH